MQLTRNSGHDKWPLARSPNTIEVRLQLLTLAGLAKGRRRLSWRPGCWSCAKRCSWAGLARELWLTRTTQELYYDVQAALSMNGHLLKAKYQVAEGDEKDEKIVDLWELQAKKAVC